MMLKQNEVNCIVLMAAYNGIKWIDEQISSINRQDGVSVTVCISVDLSTDGTHSHLITKYSHLNNVHILSYGDVFGGAGPNFYRLIRDVKIDDYDVIALSDQDDIWHQNKLLNAIQKLQQYDCFSSNVTAFWEDGREALIDKAQPQQCWDYLFEAAGPGCTYVFKREFGLVFQEWLRRHHEVIANKVSLHDWLIYAFARHNGYSWYIDPNPSMRYRQHQNNQVGTNNNLAAAKKRLRLIKDKWYKNQIISIATLLELEDNPVVKNGLMNGYVGNIYLLININKLRRRTRDKLALAFVLLFNIF